MTLPVGGPNGRVALTGSGWNRGGVEGALLAAGYDIVVDATDVPVDAVVAVSDDPRAVVAARALGAPCLVVRTSTPDLGDLVETVMVGADGVVTGAASAAEFLAALRTVTSGGLAVSPRDAERVVECLRTSVWADRPQVELTPRQQAVLELIVRGHSVKQTARELGIVVKTVENTQSRLYRRLGVRNRSQAVALAIVSGLVGDSRSAESPAVCEG